MGEVRHKLTAAQEAALKALAQSSGGLKVQSGIIGHDACQVEREQREHRYRDVYQRITYGTAQALERKGLVELDVTVFTYEVGERYSFGRDIYKNVKAARSWRPTLTEAGAALAEELASC